MTFSFDATAGASQNTAKPKLEGNKIYTVNLEECVIEDIVGKKDPTALYKVIKLKFSNEDGMYEHTIFEPKPDDFKRGESKYNDKKTGEEKTIPQPSNVESMMLFFKHVIDAFVPALADQINNGKKTISAPDWDSLRKIVKKMVDIGVGKESKIKLMKNKKGEGTFPGFFTALNKGGEAYLRNNFIGQKIAFTPYEANRILKEQSAVPTNMAEDDIAMPTNEGSENLDLDFDIAAL